MPLKKIPVDKVRVGMFLHKLEGAWLEHPFWKTRFVIEDGADLQLLQRSGVRECWIDAGKGLDVAVAPPPGPAPARPPTADADPATDGQPVVTEKRAALPVRQPLEAELKRAAAICERGREAVKAMFGEARLGRTIETERCLPLVQDIADSVARNPGALISLARLKTRDDYSYLHSVAVCALMVALARQSGMDDEACRQAGLAGLVHDIGKAKMPLEVLNKPGRLTEAEFDIMRTHPEQGHELLREAPGATPQMLDVVLHHHERVDGTGYPFRLDATRISLFARMGAICDVYDAITSNRPYKVGWDPAESIARMASWSGHFDPELFNVFMRSLGIYPTGSLVRLESGRLAVVIEQSPANLVAPVVKIYFSTRSQLPITPVRLDLSAPGCKDRIVGREPRGSDHGMQFEQLWAGPDAVRHLRA